MRQREVTRQMWMLAAVVIENCEDEIYQRMVDLLVEDGTERARAEAQCLRAWDAILALIERKM